MKKVLSLVLITLCVAVCSMALVACGGGSDSAKASITLSKSELTLVYGESATVTADVKNYDGNVTWKSSNNQVATVDGGIITAVKYGTAKITASIGDTVASVTVTVNQLEVIADEELSIEKGSSLGIGATVKYNGQTVEAEVEYESADTEIASVSVDGTVSAKKFGRTSVTLTASYNGITVEEEIDIIVALDVDVTTNVEIVELYTGEILKDGKIGEKELTVSVKKNDVDVPMEFTWKSNDEDVATVTKDTQSGDKATVTAVDVGSTKIIATFSYDGSSVDVEFTVNCEMPEYELKDITLDMSKQESVNSVVVTVPEEISVEDIDEIKVKNNVLNISGKDVNANTLTITDANFSKGSTEVKVRTGKTLYVSNLVCADMIIGSYEDMMAFLEKYKDNEEGEYYALSANIDLDGLDVTSYTGHYLSEDVEPTNIICMWKATFDGRGYAIKNAKYMHGLFRHIEPTGVVENLGIINPQKMINGGGLIANEIKGTIQNCFVYGNLTNVGQGAFCMTEYAGSNITNCIALVENAEGITGGYAGINNSASGTNKNNYAISATRTQGMFANEEETVGLYSSISEFLSAENDLSEFNGLWEIVGGLPVMKYVIDEIGWDKVAITNDSEYLFDGDTVYTNVRDAVTYLKEEVENVTLENGIIKVNGDLSGSKDITVVVDVLGKYKAEKSFSVLPFIDKTEIVIDVDKTKGFNVDLSLINSNLEYADVTSVILNGSNLTYSENSGKVFVANSELGSVEIGEAQISLFTTKGVYKVSGYVVTQMINSVEDFKSIFVSGLDAKGKYYALSTNLDFNGEDITSNTGYAGCSSFAGTLDGRGYAIINAKYTHGLFASISQFGTVMNLSVINSQKLTNGGGFIANECYGTIKDCFVYGTLTAVGQGAFCMTEYAGSSISNCFAFVENAEGVTGGYAAINGTSGGTNTNNFVISSTRTAGMYVGNAGTALQYEGVYTSISEFIDDNNDLSGFTGLWTIKNGIPLLKNSVNYIESLFSGFAITNETSVVEDGDKVLHNGLKGFVTYSLKQEVSGISINYLGELSIHEVSNGTTFTVVCSALGKFSTEKEFTVTVFTERDCTAKSVDISVSNNANTFDISTIDADLDAQNVILTLNGNPLTISQSGNTVTVDGGLFSTLTRGNNELVLISDAKGLKCRFTAYVADLIIKDQATFNAFFVGFQSTYSKANTLVAMGADYDAGNVNVSTEITGSTIENVYYYGRFDGRGYTVSNVKVVSGFFGPFGYGTVENFGLKNVTLTADKSGAFGKYIMTGTVKNCYLVLDIPTTGWYGGIVYRVGSSTSAGCYGGSVENCVIIATGGNKNLDGFAGEVAEYNHQSNLKNVYGISTVLTQMWVTQTGTATNTHVYTSVDGLNGDTADGNALTTLNGQGYWKVVESELYFNNTKVGE